MRGYGKADGGLKFRKADLEGLCKTARRRRPTTEPFPESLSYGKTLEKQMTDFKDPKEGKFLFESQERVLLISLLSALSVMPGTSQSLERTVI